MLSAEQRNFNLFTCEAYGEYGVDLSISKFELFHVLGFGSTIWKIYASHASEREISNCMN